MARGRWELRDGERGRNDHHCSPGSPRQSLSCRNLPHNLPSHKKSRVAPPRLARDFLCLSFAEASGSEISPVHRNQWPLLFTNQRPQSTVFRRVRSCSLGRSSLFWMYRRQSGSQAIVTPIPRQTSTEPASRWYVGSRIPVSGNISSPVYRNPSFSSTFREATFSG